MFIILSSAYWNSYRACPLWEFPTHLTAYNINAKLQKNSSFVFCVHNKQPFPTISVIRIILSWYSWEGLSYPKYPTFSRITIIIQWNLRSMFVPSSFHNLNSSVYHSIFRRSSASFVWYLRSLSSTEDLYRNGTFPCLRFFFRLPLSGAVSAFSDSVLPALVFLSEASFGSGIGSM